MSDQLVIELMEVMVICATLVSCIWLIMEAV